MRGCKLPVATNATYRSNRLVSASKKRVGASLATIMAIFATKVWLKSGVRGRFSFTKFWVSAAAARPPGSSCGVVCKRSLLG